MRLILLGVLIAVVFLLVRNYLRRSSVAKDAKADIPADTVKCAVCQTHVPKSAAIERDGRYFCSEAHSREDKGR